MGDRYTITATAGELAKRYKIEVPERYAARYNASPTQVLPVITQESEGISFFYWGQIPDWSKNKAISSKLIFANKETLTEKASTKQAVLQRRCLIPADGYYDWRQVSKKGRIPYRFIFGDNQIVSFAGIWEEFEDEEENTVHTFKIITAPANTGVDTLSARMPVTLKEQEEAAWLKSDNNELQLQDLLKTFPAEKIGHYTVSPKIADANYDHPSLIQPMAPADQHGNYSLFD